VMISYRPPCHAVPRELSGGVEEIVKELCVRRDGTHQAFKESEGLLPKHG